MADPVGAVVVAAGSGSRFGSEGATLPKQFLDLAGRPVLARAIEALLPGEAIRQTVVVLASEYCDTPPEWLGGLPVRIVAGGASRTDSVRRGLEALDDSIETVLIHDGARPLLTASLVRRILSASAGGRAVIPGLPVTDTLKAVGSDGRVDRTVDRSTLWAVQTPQAFPLRTLLEAHDRAAAEDLRPTDDAALFEHFGLPVHVIEGEARNLKVTTPDDLQLAAALLGIDEFRSDEGEKDGEWR